MKVRFKKLSPKAVKPSYSKQGDAGLDLTAISYTVESTNSGSQLIYDTGIAIEIPQGYAGFILPRSSIKNKDLTLANSVGLIDSGYRDSIKCIFNLLGNDYGKDKQPRVYNEGDRIAQLVILSYPTINLMEAENLSTSERGTGGFGSTN